MLSLSRKCIPPSVSHILRLIVTVFFLTIFHSFPYSSHGQLHQVAHSQPPPLLSTVSTNNATPYAALSPQFRDILVNIAQHRREQAAAPTASASKPSSRNARELISTTYVREALKITQSYASYSQHDRPDASALKTVAPKTPMVDAEPAIPPTPQSRRSSQMAADAAVLRRHAALQKAIHLAEMVAGDGKDHGERERRKSTVERSLSNKPLQLLPHPSAFSSNLYDGSVLARSGLRLADTTLVDASSIQRHNISVSSPSPLTPRSEDDALFAKRGVSAASTAATETVEQKPGQSGVFAAPTTPIASAVIAHVDDVHVPSGSRLIEMDLIDVLVCCFFSSTADLTILFIPPLTFHTTPF